MTTVRRYDDPCGIARALDVVGDRWALLVVRELIFGPRRFAQLRGGLHGISPNVLSQRLRELEDAGIVRKDVLDPPASVTIYELAERGRELEPILIELGRWGSQEPVATQNELSVSALLLALKTVFDPTTAVDGIFALKVDGEWFRVSVADSSIAVIRARTEQASAVVETDVATLRAVALGREAIAEAERDGRLTITGSRRLAGRFARMFRVPPRRGG
jgi:DNA-binding HxlR family transcriptional regulator